MRVYTTRSDQIHPIPSLRIPPYWPITFLSQLLCLHLVPPVCLSVRLSVPLRGLSGLPGATSLGWLLALLRQPSVDSFFLIVVFLTQAPPLLLQWICRGVFVPMKHPDWWIQMVSSSLSMSRTRPHWPLWATSWELWDRYSNREEQSSEGARNPAAVRLGREHRHSDPSSSVSNHPYNSVLCLKEMGLFVHFIVHLSTQIPSY